MNTTKTLYWLPRILIIVFIVFISLFALDVFDAGYSFWQMTLALSIHLIPSFALIIITLIAWKHEKTGGVLFIIFGIVFMFFFKTYDKIMSFLMISLPLFIIGFLFLLNHFRKKDSIN